MTVLRPNIDSWAKGKDYSGDPFSNERGAMTISCPMPECTWRIDAVDFIVDEDEVKPAVSMAAAFEKHSELHVDE